MGRFGASPRRSRCGCHFVAPRDPSAPAPPSCRARALGAHCKCWERQGFPTGTAFATEGLRSTSHGDRSVAETALLAPHLGADGHRRVLRCEGRRQHRGREPLRRREGARAAAPRCQDASVRGNGLLAASHERRRHPLAQPVRLARPGRSYAAPAGDDDGRRASASTERSDERAALRRREGAHHRGVVGSGLVLRGAVTAAERPQERAAPSRRRLQRQGR